MSLKDGYKRIYTAINKFVDISVEQIRNTRINKDKGYDIAPGIIVNAPDRIALLSNIQKYYVGRNVGGVTWIHTLERENADDIMNLLKKPVKASMKIGEGTFGYIMYYPDLNLAAKKFKLAGKDLVKELGVYRLLIQSKCTPELVYFDLTSEEKSVYIEYFPYSLQKAMQMKEMTKDNLHSIFRDIIRCFAYLNSQGVLHLDIKPGNILVSKDLNRGILIDFGMCKIDRTFDQKVYRSEYIGTLGYIGPEIMLRRKKLIKENYDSKQDLFVIGIMILTVYLNQISISAGNPPNFNSILDFDGFTEEEIAERMVTLFGWDALYPEEKNMYDTMKKLYFNVEGHDQVKFLKEDFFVPYNKILDPKLIDILAHLITMDPKQRFTYDELLEAYDIPNNNPPLRNQIMVPYKGRVNGSNLNIKMLTILLEGRIDCAMNYIEMMQLTSEKMIKERAYIPNPQNGCMLLIACLYDLITVIEKYGVYKPEMYAIIELLQGDIILASIYDCYGMNYNLSIPMNRDELIDLMMLKFRLNRKVDDLDSFILCYQSGSFPQKILRPDLVPYKQDLKLFIK